MNWFKKSVKNNDHSLSQYIQECKKTGDFIDFQHSKAPHPFWVSYFITLVDAEILHRDILPYLYQMPSGSYEAYQQVLPIEKVVISSDLELIQKKMLHGYVLIRLKENDTTGILVPCELDKSREVTIPEVEYSVVGPKDSFVESIMTNLNLIRKRLPIPQLQMREFTVGALSQTKVAVLYIEGIANEENVNTVLQRIGDIHVPQILDSSYISQLITDNDNSPFPQVIDTERPDRAAGVLAEGSIVILVDGSPHVLIGPTTLISFFSAFEDNYFNWQIASVFRVIRIFAVAFSVLITPIYVAVLNYHYELIPKDLMATLVTSRRVIPLTPFLEAVFLEIAIELLREAGARLPTKVGQTMGIVGGIVIGTASVEAGLTSNVLLILVALAGLASFTMPVYKMANAVRLIRFPLLLLADLWGLIGLALGILFLLTHLLRLTSFGRPYLEPIFPPRTQDYKDTFLRLPFSMQNKRPVFLQAQDQTRFYESKVIEEKDIDE